MEKVTYPIGRFVFEGMTAVQKQEWIEQIEQYPTLLRATVEGFSQEQLDTPYRTGGWTVRQVVHHVADFSTNVLTRFKLALTENNPTIKPFLEEKWAQLSDTRSMPIESSLSIIDGTYARLFVLLKSMSVAEFERQFYHPEKGAQISLKAFLSFTKWHSFHHLAHIQSLKERNNW
ncbi:MAG: putative metal-dependent hydrolase [Candidatus Pristimantibacillus lignocellulolyticus]|uniref:Metal-dependent hydrolase n=1 Tax=Candidatus Pristimantibacillus lignocellulolyticus TaxID=2994561 RepID=A0A9J6ZB15_9BACL|nr:MAG: putative metal-dependent hydrolase [Candidatus Pristimantibacillus lignocellulolyticus]